MLLALAPAVVAGEVPNNVPQSPPPQPPSTVTQEPAEEEKMYMGTIDTLVEVMLNLLVGARSPF